MKKHNSEAPRAAPSQEHTKFKLTAHIFTHPKTKAKKHLTIQ
jgi:hypothetical protein